MDSLLESVEVVYVKSVERNVLRCNCGQAGRDLLPAHVAPAGEDDGRPLRDERFDDAETDPGGTAEDEGNLVFKPHATSNWYLRDERARIVPGHRLDVLPGGAEI